jgi:hypothetical protein
MFASLSEPLVGSVVVDAGPSPLLGFEFAQRKHEIMRVSKQGHST